MQQCHLTACLTCVFDGLLGSSVGDAGLAEAMREELRRLGYVTEMVFVKAFRSEQTLDRFIEMLLMQKKVMGEVCAAEWVLDPVAGMLRGWWGKAAGAAAAQDPKQPAAEHRVELAWIGLGCKAGDWPDA